MKTKMPPRHGIPALLDCKPLRVTGLTENGKPFEPELGKPGSELTFNHNGQIITAQVWSNADVVGHVWAVSDGVAYQVIPNHGSVVRTLSYRRAAA